MKVLLINTNKIRPVVAPIGLEYVGEYLRSNGVEVFIFDTVFQRGLKELINKVKPDFIGVGIRNTDDCSYPLANFFLTEIKKLIENINKLTSSPIIAGGVGFSVMPESSLEYLGLDFGIYVDGEEAFLKFMKEYPKFTNVPNLIYRMNGKYKRNKQVFFDLKKLNPSRNLFNNKRYFEEGGMGSVETKRGCIKDCIYCADVVGKGKQLRLRDVDSVVQEIEILIRMGINYLHFCDSEFNIPYHHAVDVCRGIIKRKINKNLFWYCYCSPKEFDIDLAILMKEAGCVGINFGVDSASDKILKILKKDFETKDLIKLGKICRKVGITFMFDLLLGGPEEDEKTVIETINTIKKINPDVVGTAIGIRIYDKTYIADIVKKEGINKENKNLYGFIENNSNFLKPIFYISAKIGKKIFPLVEKLTAGDKRFLFTYGKNRKNYNYNQNTILVEAIKKGLRGAFWDILRRC